MFDHEPKKDIYGNVGESMRSDDLQRCLDLRRADLDPELFPVTVALYPYHCDANRA